MPVTLASVGLRFACRICETEHYSKIMLADKTVSKITITHCPHQVYEKQQKPQ